MISFQSNRQILKSAQILESRTRNIYPHLSTSRMRVRLGYENPDPLFFKRMKKDYGLMRQMISESNDCYSSIVYTLSQGKIGNCTEDSLFTELIGKINGQKNIYTGAVCLKKDNLDARPINHVVAFITDVDTKNKKEIFFKNKDAVIIDPWLGITDFAGSYFAKLKSVYRKYFQLEKNNYFTTFSNDNLAMKLLRNESKTLEEFNTKRKQFFPKTKLGILPFNNNMLKEDTLAYLKEYFPELTIKNFKKIELSAKKQKSANTDKIA